MHKKTRPVPAEDPAAAPPATPSALLAAIAARFPDLSKRLQQIARFSLDNPNEMALGTVATIAKETGVQPSTIIRFANAFGYSGFSEMQRIFQSSLLERVPSYSERMRKALALQGEAPVNDTAGILQEFCSANIVSLRHLAESIPGDTLETAIALLADAGTVHVMGLRRSFPTASYLAYALSHAERRAHLLTGFGGLFAEQGQLVVPGDVLVAISSNPYAPETVAMVDAAAGKGVAVIAITDSPLSPIARPAKVSFCIHDAELRGFRSLTATLCLAQALAVGLALKSVREGQ